MQKWSNGPTNSARTERCVNSRNGTGRTTRRVAARPVSSSLASRRRDGRARGAPAREHLLANPPRTREPLLCFRQHGRRSLCGRARLERRSRGIFERELHRFGLGPAEKPGDQKETEIDPRGDAAGGYQVSVLDDARVDGNGAEFGEEIMRVPMRRRPLALEQAGGTEHQGAPLHTEVT